MTTPGTDAELYRRARAVIPGGTQLLSKRPELFLPEQWPTYSQRASGCTIWDLDGREFVDMTTTGIGACLLGYADPDVNDAAKQAIDRGSLTSLNAPDEVELAERLVELHPWADMVRYARTGGEAMSVAVRIARAASGRDAVAVCGYHGWSDWYIAANLGDDARLDGHLLPGLQPTGVPTALRNTALPFHYNHVDQLDAIVDRHGSNLGAIVMEPLRFDEPTDGFLERVREIADRHDLVLVLDEITSGWRHVFGGVHQTLGVDPDIAVYAKSISNGFPMAAIVGRRGVMEAAQGSFISSTYWTEAIGPATALRTLDKMLASNLAEHVDAIGREFQTGLRRLAELHGVPLHVSGRPALTHIEFECGDASLAVRTLFSQHMLDQGYLAGGAFYPTLAHDSAIVEGYLRAADRALDHVADSIDGDRVHSDLRGPIAHAGFQRLT